VADYLRVIEELYGALNRHDGEAMARMYAPDGRFRDPAFGELTGAEAGDMWRMLTSRADDLRVELREHSVDGDTGRARWIARYTFSRTGRPVVNDVQARFRFREDGLITDHEDSFSMRRWVGQALGGPAGLALWIPPLNLLLRSRARGDLAEFRSEG
jgi:ketosteroid isomerase-like protein